MDTPAASAHARRACAFACSILCWSTIVWVACVSAAVAASDPGVRSGPGAGNPLSGLTPDQTTLFMAGEASFSEVEQLTDGLGPRFNLDSCAGCHAYPAQGGSSPPVNPQATIATAMGARNTVPSFIAVNGPIREVRYKFGANGARDGGVHSLFVISGRTDASGSAAGCTAVQEDFNTQFARGNVSLRIPTPTFGAGLMENIPDSTLAANLAANARIKAQMGIAGHLNTEGNDGRVARFGWKAQNVSLLMFSGEAYNVEMGITNELFQTERDETPGCQFAALPNDVGNTAAKTPADAVSAIEKFSFFSRFLAPPAPSKDTPGGADSIARGRKLFEDVGCALCHTPTLHTGNSNVAALRNQPVNLYSDLLVHDMGPGLEDGVTQGQAGPREFRTAPLWGLGQRLFFLHDGRTADLKEAIQAHRSGNFLARNESEASGVVKNFDRLQDEQKQDVLNFLRSL